MVNAPPGFPPGSHIPQPQRAILGGRSQAAAVRGESTSVDASAVAVEGGEAHIPPAGRVLYVMTDWHKGVQGLRCGAGQAGDALQMTAQPLAAIAAGAGEIGLVEAGIAKYGPGQLGAAEAGVQNGRLSFSGTFGPTQKRKNPCSRPPN